jgi:NAD(P)-dependent dehydrogenase (short-subunit alcohol dehydrogenase family)
MSEEEQRVAVITGGSQGIGAGLVAAYRRRGWVVVANSRTIRPSEDRGVLTVDGDVSESRTIDRIIGGALDRFGRIDTSSTTLVSSSLGLSPTTPMKTMHLLSVSTSLDFSG